MKDSTTRPENEYLTVPELAALLRIKERKVYDLAASGKVPCSRATGKLLFPAREVRAWIAKNSSGSMPGAGAGAGAGPAAAAAPPPILLGSHDPLLDWAIRQSRCGLATFFDGSLDGLERFAAGEGVAAGLHLFDAASGDWNVPQVARALAGANAVLVTFASRRRGLVLRPGGPPVGRIADLRGRRVVPRQPGSGADALFRHLARAEGLDPATLVLAPEARTETEAVQSVARGEADAAFGMEALARDFGLDFAPVVEERFDIVADRRAWFEPPLQRLFAFCRTPAFRDRAAAMGGYDLEAAGAVRWNA